MKKILSLWIFIVVILVGGLTYIGFNMQFKNKDYYQLEEKLLKSAKDYYAQYPNLLPAGDYTLNANKLVEEEFLNELTFNLKPCTGYVKVKKNYISHDFVPYIKCDGYSTKNYNEGELDENNN